MSIGSYLEVLGSHPLAPTHHINANKPKVLKIPGLGVSFKPAVTLTDAERSAMLLIRDENMTCVAGSDGAADRKKFDVALEGCMAVLMTDRSGELAAYYLAYEYVIDASGGPYTVLYGRYLHAAPAFRGKASLYLSGVIYGLRYARVAARGRLFMGGPYLPNSYIFTQRMVPMWSLQDPDTPPEVRSILSALGPRVAGADFDPVQGTVQCTVRAAPRRAHSEAAARLLARYETFNPRWRDGTALLCVGRITSRALARAVQIAIGRGLGRRSSARTIKA